VDRRAFVASTLALLAAPLAVEAQQAGKVYRIGYLASGSASASPPFVEALWGGLRELRWADGQNIVIEYRFAEGRFDRLPALAAELVRLKMDLIVAGPSPPAVAAKNATRTIPVVMVGAGDPVGLGLIANLARPGGNVTGVSYDVSLQTIDKGLQLLKETLPKIRRVAILWNPANPGNALAVRNVRAAAGSLGLQLQFREARGPDQFDDAFAAMAKEHAEALLVVPDSIFNLHRARLADLAAKNWLPSMHGIREYVEAGSLMSYGPSLSAIYRRAAFFVDKILKGTKPADLPVEQPTKFELVINLKTAKALGLTIPPSVLARADELIH
jgi:putative ABC transport system substrate-binding protein